MCDCGCLVSHCWTKLFHTLGVSAVFGLHRHRTAIKRLLLTTSFRFKSKTCRTWFYVLCVFVGVSIGVKLIELGLCFMANIITSKVCLEEYR